MDIVVIVHKEDGPDVIGAIHAKNGRPVELRITRDVMTEVMHLSVQEALQLAWQIDDMVG